MDIKELQRNWEQFGRTDPLRAILTGAPAPEGWDEEEFFRRGRLDVEAAFAILKRHGSLPRPGRALDFGCGVGRLTQALCERFDSVVGVDIAPAMIEQARRYNRFGDRCEYVVNDREDLSRFPDRSFDFVYSLIVLQHMRLEYSMRYVGEFLRITAPGGVIVFQVPAALKSRSRSLPRDAFRARIEQPHEIETLYAGEHRKLAVRVSNASRKRWADPQGAAVVGLNLGNHWLSETAGMIALDDGRAAVPAPLNPGQTIEVEILVTAPPSPGRYILQLDLVQEGISWFEPRGSPSWKWPVEVRPAPGAAQEQEKAAAQAQKPEAGPIMEMHCVPRASVERLVRSTGATLLGVHSHHGAGPDFENYQYFVSIPLKPRPRRARRLRAMFDAMRGVLHRAASRES